VSWKELKNLKAKSSVCGKWSQVWRRRYNGSPGQSVRLPKESAEITWDVHLGDAMLNIDPQLLQEVFSELITNAFLHDRGKGPIMAAAKIADARFLFTFHEPKSRFDSSTQNWGREPLRKITLRHYGLGLNRARGIVEAHGGKLHAQYDPNVSALITTLTLPVAGKSPKQA
jgi:K+-sensing histidine kinase KdpD